MKEIITGKEVSHPMFSTTPPTKVKRGKIVSAEEAVRIIRDSDTVATGGFVGTGFAEEIAVKLEERFIKTAKPRDLTLERFVLHGVWHGGVDGAWGGGAEGESCGVCGSIWRWRGAGSGASFVFSSVLGECGQRRRITHRFSARTH